MDIRISGSIQDSIVDGPSLRYVLFTQGCPHRCEGCHNPQTHDFNGGHITTTEKIMEQITSNPLTSGVTFSGGEPFSQPKPLALLAKEIKEKNYNLMCYSGYTFEELLMMSQKDEDIKTILELTDILVDGRFVLAEKSLMLKFRGSKNQRLLNCRESMAQGKAVLLED